MNDFMRNTYMSLLQEDNVGTVKSPTYRLPDGDFTYGRFVPRDREGAGEG